MSYCRPAAGHDAYVVHLISGTLECLGCKLSGPRGSGDFVTRSRKKMLAHLLLHRAKRHKLGRAIARLRREIETVGDRIRPSKAYLEGKC